MRDALNNGGGSVAKLVYLYNRITKNIKALEGGINASLTTDDQDVVPVSAPGVHDKAAVGGKLADKPDKSTTNNSATA